jgi:hypothetical protein
MPFDATGLAPTPDLIDTYRARREMAAACWREIKPSRFDLRTWQCGTTACALGWLANQRIDGWAWCHGAPYPTGQGNKIRTRINDIWQVTAEYFDLHVTDASALFGGGSSRRLYGCDPFFVRARDVADKLLGMPYHSASVQGPWTLSRQPLLRRILDQI